MSYRARDFVQPALRVAMPTHVDPLVEAAGNVLAEQSKALRATHEAMFRQVDEVLKKPRPNPKASDARLRLVPERTGKCAWCGDPFLFYSRRWRATCSKSCGQKYRQWLKRRANSSQHLDRGAMMSDKDKLEATADTLDEVAVFADYLRVLALGANESAKADRLEEQAGDLRQFANIYRQAASAA